MPSLVGSEMCIRDSPFISASGCLNPGLGQLGDDDAYRRWQARVTNYRRDGKSSRARTKTIRRNRSGQTRGYHQDQDQVNSHSVNSGNLYTSDYHSERYYRTLPPHPSLVTSPYRTNIQAEPLLIFRPKQVVVTYFTQAIEACRSHATTKSAQFPWYAVTALQPWPAAMMWICFMAPRMLSLIHI